jgi:long-chain acyl-CoA synthetase
VNTKIENLMKNSGDTKHAVYDSLIFSKVRKILGGRVRLLVSGGAPISQEVKYFTIAAFSCPVLEAYGTAETAGALCSTCRWETKAGIVGGPLACLKLKLRDIPELGYLTTDDPPRGEVMIKGNSIFKGYFRQPELTREVLDKDGWLSLGDVATILPNGSL